MSEVQFRHNRLYDDVGWQGMSLLQTRGVCCGPGMARDFVSGARGRIGLGEPTELLSLSYIRGHVDNRRRRGIDATLGLARIANRHVT